MKMAPVFQQKTKAMIQKTFFLSRTTIDGIRENVYQRILWFLKTSPKIKRAVWWRHRLQHFPLQKKPPLKKKRSRHTHTHTPAVCVCRSVVERKRSNSVERIASCGIDLMFIERGRPCAFHLILFIFIFFACVCVCVFQPAVELAQQFHYLSPVFRFFFLFNLKSCGLT